MSTNPRKKALNAVVRPIPDNYQSYSFTDQGNTEHFIHEYKDTLRYDHGRKRWLVWRGHWWEQARGGEIHQLNMRLLHKRERLARAFTDAEDVKKHLKWITTTKNGRHLDEIINRARNFLPIAVDGDAWDRDPMLFAVANGVIDLKSGKLREGRPDDLITLHTNVSYSTDALCPRADRFFSEIFLDRADLIQFIDKALGYSLTGFTNEQCFFILHEEGSNGKSTFLNIVSHIIGDYARSTPSETLTTRKSSGPRNDVARLAGARFVSSVETSLGGEAAEELLKRITGDDVVVARFLNNEFFEFRPQFKIWMACNHQPVIKGSDVAIWRRIHNIPFDRHFAAHERDKDLLEKLKAESPGILARMVRGCLAWQNDRLEQPESVRKSTQAYQNASNPLTDFIDERCKLGSELTILKQDLYDSYVEYCGECRERPLTKRFFGIYLKAKGFAEDRGNQGRYWIGLKA